MANILTLWSFQIKDALGVTATHNIFVDVDDATSLVNLITANQVYQNLLDPITSGQIAEATVRIYVPISDTVVPTPQVGSEVERGLLTNFSQYGSTYKNGIEVPSLNPNLLVSGKVDLTNVDFVAWAAWLTAAHSGIIAVSKFAATLIGVLDALITFRKHRKAENRRSTAVTP